MIDKAIDAGCGAKSEFLQDGEANPVFGRRHGLPGNIGEVNFNKFK